MKKLHLLSIAIILCFGSTAQKFISEEVAIDELKGTLTIPKKKTKTAILMISGSGPTDRDGNSAMGLSNNSLKMVSEELTLAGFAVLRFDKRGIAESAKAINNPRELRFEDLIDDTKEWLNLLSEKGYQNLIVIGHSQGSLVGMVASQNNDKVKAFISIAGSGTDVGTILLEQLGKQAPILVHEAKVTLDSIKSGHTVNKVNPFLVSLFGPQIQDFIRSYVMYDPSKEITKLDIPVLIINGTTDIQVGVDQANMLKKAYPNALLQIIEGMNHVLKDAPAEMAANMATYNNPTLPLSDGLMDSILSFIKKI